MTEFDFDELDKAVASAMGGSSENTPASTSDNNNIPVKVDTSAVPMVHERPQPPAVRRSRGRFMDIAPRPSARPVAAPATPEPETKPEEPAPQQMVETGPDTKEAPHASNFHATHDSTDEPLPSTPFLPDAKDRVEKRPLNAGIMTEPIEEPEPMVVAEESVESSTENQSPAQEITPESTELTNIDSQPVEFTTLDTTAPPPIDAKPVPELEPSVVPKEVAEPTNGAIFDTSQYHKPIEAKKKSSKVGLILWIVSLVAVGAAAGWAIYTFVLPMILG